MLEKSVLTVRRFCALLLSCTGAFVGVHLIVSNVLGLSWPIWYSEPVDLIRTNFVIPWGFALGVLCIAERSRAGAKPRLDFALLTLLLLWIIAPFAIRFGFTFNNVSSWNNAFIATAGVYMATASQGEQERALSHGALCLLMLALSLVWGGLLLFCAATAQSIDLGMGGYSFGVELLENGCLCSGMHYNVTGMIAVCACFMDMSGFARSGRKSVKALYALGAAMMAVVIVLTQSRTARYALLLCSAVGAFGWLQSCLSKRKPVLRFGVSVALAAVLLLGGYVGAERFTAAALRSYEEKGVVSVALAEETEAPLEQAPETGGLQVRNAVDASFSGRTQIWTNVLRYWKENPKLFVIGCGVGRIGSKIVEGTIHEKIGAVQLHNSYLQFIADYGLIGFALLAGFMVLMIRPLFKAVFAVGEKRKAGHCALAMLVGACLLTAMMESAPLAPMGMMNGMMFFALAMLSHPVKGG